MNVIYIDGLSVKTRTALKENGELTEIIYESNEGFEPGNIYVGRITKVLKGQFIFIEIGDKRTAFLQPDINKESAIFNEKGKIRIKEGDSILVQLSKPAVDEKGAVVTTRLNFTGRYSVLIANDCGIGVSKKIRNEEKRNELKKLASEILPDGFGLIMRTCCEDTPVKDIIDEIETLKNNAEKLIEKAKYIKPPMLIYEEISAAARAVRDLSSLGDTEIVVNNKDIIDTLRMQTGIETITYYDNPDPMFHYYGIESAIEKALHRRIWLKSGGYIVIDYTEAMNVIDVNSGKMTGKHLKDFALKVNLEAAEEAARQIRLRNLTGMIIIDFIDMDSQEDIERVSKRLKECIAKDRITTSLVGMTSLGLMQLTRKKVGLPLHKILLCSCGACTGTGMVENEFYVVEKLLNEVADIFAQTIYTSVLISGSHLLISALKKNKKHIKDVEDRFEKVINLEEISTAKPYYYKIEKKIH